MTLFERFDEILNDWENLKYADKYPNSDPSSEKYMLFEEGLCDYLKEELSEQGIDIVDVDDQLSLDIRQHVYKLTDAATETYVSFYGDYDSYQSIHNYDDYHEVSPKQVTITEWS